MSACRYFGVDGGIDVPKKILAFLFALYIAVVLKLTVFRSVTLSGRTVNFLLFSDLASVLKEKGLSPFLRLFLGNIGWFMPLGFLLPAINKKYSFLSTVITGLFFSLFIETLQFVFKKGVFEIDDLILNTFGTALGFFAYGMSRFCIDKIRRLW